MVWTPTWSLRSISWWRIAAKKVVCFVNLNKQTGLSPLSVSFGGVHKKTAYFATWSLVEQWRVATLLWVPPPWPDHLTSSGCLEVLTWRRGGASLWIRYDHIPVALLPLLCAIWVVEGVEGLEDGEEVISSYVRYTVSASKIYVEYGCICIYTSLYIETKTPDHLYQL